MPSAVAMTSSTVTVPTGERAASTPSAPPLRPLCAPSALPLSLLSLLRLLPHLTSPRLASPRPSRAPPRSCATACAGCVQQTMPGCTRCGERIYAPNQTLTLTLALVRSLTLTLTLTRTRTLTLTLTLNPNPNPNPITLTLTL